MASRPLPPGRRGRGARATPTLHLPDVKILSDAPTAPPTSSYAEQVRAHAPPPVAASVVEPEHESTTKETEYEPAPVRSVKAFVSSLEKHQDPVTPVSAAPAAAAGEDAPPRTHTVVVETTHAPPAAPLAAPPVAPPRVVAEKPAAQVATHVAPKESVVPPPVQQVVAPAPLVQAVAAAPLVARPAPVEVAAPAVNMPTFEGFHPFNALFPMYAVPEIPETVDCVFDDEALEMQKNVMKVVKKVFGKDRTKLEDFKINSRLFGNNFMDPLEYVESLVKDLGGNRALVLVPCLVSIQPDFMKRNSMLIAARNYRLRNLSKLEAALDRVEVAAPASAPVQVEHAVPESESVVPVSVAAASTVVPTAVINHEPAHDEDARNTPEADAIVQETSNSSVVEENVLLEVKAEVLPLSHVDHCYAQEPAAVLAPPIEEVVAEVVIEEAPHPTPLVSEPVAFAVSEPVLYAVSEPQAIEAVLVESSPAVEASAVVWEQATELVPVEQKYEASDSIAIPASVEEKVVESAPNSHPNLIVESEPSVIPAVTTALGAEKIESNARLVTVDTTVPSEASSSSSSAPVTPSAASPVHHKPVRRKSTISLFGEEIDDDDDESGDEKDEQDVKTILTTPSAVAPVSTPDLARTPSPELAPASSFHEAESLFGEVIPVVVKPAAQTPTPSPAPTTSVLKPPPARTGMLFGFASVGAESDSDSDSEFSD